MHPWLLLLLAGVAEIGWVVGLKYSEGFSRLWPSVFTLAAMAVSMILLGLAVRTLPIGTAYAVWTGIGAAGTFLVGVWFFGDAANFGRYLGVLLIICGVVVLRLAH